MSLRGHRWDIHFGVDEGPATLRTAGDHIHVVIAARCSDGSLSMSGVVYHENNRVVVLALRRIKGKVDQTELMVADRSAGWDMLAPMPVSLN